VTKRQKFLATSFALTIGFIGIGFLENQFRFFAIGGLTLLTVILFIWSLWEGLGRNMTLLTLILPTFFTAGVGIFWFLLPANPFARLPVLLFYGFGIYALSLTSNIYTVSAVRTIALLRAARGVGFVLTLATCFLVFDAILSLRENIFITAPAIFVCAFPLFIQGFWIMLLEKKISGYVLLLALVFSLILGELSAGLFFWPVTVVVGSLFLTVAVYVLLGLGQAKLEGRLFSQTVREYISVGAVVLLGTFFATHWGN
jgi:hypothetical protein